MSALFVFVRELVGVLVGSLELGEGCKGCRWSSAANEPDGPYSW